MCVDCVLASPRITQVDPGDEPLPEVVLSQGSSQNGGGTNSMLVVLKPNRIIRKCMDANCSSFHLRVFLGLSNLQGQWWTSTLSIPRDIFGERKAKFNLGMSRTTQM
jgi:hypothetical protein